MHLAGRGGIADLINFLDLLDMAKDGKKHKPLLAEILRRETGLGDKQRDLVARERALNDELGGIADKQAKADRAAEIAEAKQAKVNADSKALVEAKREMSVDRAELDKLAKDLDARENEQAAEKKSIASQKAAIANANKKLKAYEADLETRAKRIREALTA